MTCKRPYRGRIAPSPTGYLHLGHARTFWTAQSRARQEGGVVVLRNEDLDGPRCKPEFVQAMIEDLHWFGFKWQEGPDCGGPHGPYVQSKRMGLYRNTFASLREKGVVYPCSCSRQDVLRALSAPHAGDEEPVYPGTCRGVRMQSRAGEPKGSVPTGVNWRFRVPDGEVISFFDGLSGQQSFVSGKDFGDFIVWRHDDIPSYQLAVVIDDSAMEITEVVRGADLLVSTARQILLYRTLNLQAPLFYHCPLMTDDKGVRLAKRHDALSLRELRRQGITPEILRRGWPPGT